MRELFKYFENGILLVIWIPVYSFLHLRLMLEVCRQRKAYYHKGSFRAQKHSLRSFVFLKSYMAFLLSS